MQRRRRTLLVTLAGVSAFCSSRGDHSYRPSKTDDLLGAFAAEVPAPLVFGATAAPA